MSENNVDFLGQRSVNSIRKEINNIVNSYNNSWDVLCELFQNSFDAIMRSLKEDANKKHQISFQINVQERKIVVRDTGVGIEASKVKEIVAPNGTDKEDEEESIGEKGVGLTYTIFSCNNFIIETQNKNSYFKGRIDNASSWRRRLSSVIPSLEILEEKETDETTETYTEIILKGLDEFNPIEDDIFSQTPDVLEYIIRTKTVLGYMKKIFSENQPDLSIQYTFVDDNGKKYERPLDFSYWLPDSFVGGNKIDFVDFKTKAATYDDKQKTQKLRGKALYSIGSVTRSNRTINYYCFFAPSRDLWKDICEKNNLYFAGDKNNGMLVNGGIYVVTKGMPTGIVIEPPTTGYAGYWNNYLMLIEDDRIIFDLGRKTIPSRTKGTLKDVAKDLFNEFLPFIKYVTSDPPVFANASIQQVKKNNTYEELQKYANLNVAGIDYLKHPNSQEAAVVSIFHELIGAKILKGYHSLSSGYKQTYDLWATYDIDSSLVGSNMQSIADANGKIVIPCVIEFKFSAESIIDDLSQDIKFFNDMDLLVCWDLDEQKFAVNSIEVERIDKEDVLFYGSNYKLRWPGSYNLGAAGEKPVLALRKFIEDYNSTQV